MLQWRVPCWRLCWCCHTICLAKWTGTDSALQSVNASNRSHYQQEASHQVTHGWTGHVPHGWMERHPAFAGHRQYLHCASQQQLHARRSISRLSSGCAASSPHSLSEATPWLFTGDRPQRSSAGYSVFGAAKWRHVRLPSVLDWGTEVTPRL